MPRTAHQIARVQLGRQALDPPGEARQDMDIIVDLARRLGLDWQYPGPADVFSEMREVMPSIAGITWERLQNEGSVTYPCTSAADPGQPIIFTRSFPTGDARGHFVPSPLRNADELPDHRYPWVLITGRMLEHWHTGAMSRRSTVLDALEPSPVACLNPRSLSGLGIGSGDLVRVASRRGEVVCHARPDPGLAPGQVFLPFCHREAAANLLTSETLDPDARIPGFKFCAVRVSREEQCPQE